MSDYEKMYSVLFNKITDIVEELEEVQQVTEEMFIKQNADGKVLFANKSKKEHDNKPLA